MLTEKRVLNRLKRRLDIQRLSHSCRVACVAEKLADREGLSVKNARLAGLLHDYAKGLKEDYMRELVEKSDWEIDSDELDLPQLLHAPAGAYLVKREFKLEERDILEAIRYHTIGSPEMGKLAQIIFIADLIEPGRDFPGIESIRKEVDNGITAALIKTCDYLLEYNIDNRRIIHPNTLLLRNDCLRRKN